MVRLYDGAEATGVPWKPHLELGTVTFSGLAILQCDAPVTPGRARWLRPTGAEHV